MMPPEMAQKLKDDPVLEQQMKDDPIGTLEKMKSPLQTDPWIYRVAVISLGLVSIMTVLGVIGLSVYNKTAPDGLLVMAGTGMGALAMLLKVPGSN